jgi:2-oxoacid:acceptor oxidoreductase delta subunit (pyruvate/2-ketoisovalerate family)
MRIGAHGAPSMARYLDRGVPFDKKVQEVVGFDSLNMVYFENQERERSGQLSIDDRKKSFEEVNLTLSQEAVLREADRCFMCGDCTLCDTCFVFCPDMAILKSEGSMKNEIDYEYCKGCGICANECPRGYIEMQKER